MKANGKNLDTKQLVNAVTTDGKNFLDNRKILKLICTIKNVYHFKRYIA